MAFLAILFSLIIDRIWTPVVTWRSYGWFERWTERLHKGWRANIWFGPVGVLAVLVPPLLAVVLVQMLLASILGLLAFLFAIAVLIWTLGPRDLEADVRGFLNAWEQGDTERAETYARAVAGPGIDPKASVTLGRGVIECAFVTAHERIIGVIFWFLVLGPMGALLFRMVCVLRAKYAQEAAVDNFVAVLRVLHGILTWPSARVTAVGYALTGSFADAVRSWREAAPHWRHDWIIGNRLVLVAAGLGALQLDPHLDEDEAYVDSAYVRDALALIWRTVILIVVLLGVSTMATWMS